MESSLKLYPTNFFGQNVWQWQTFNNPIWRLSQSSSAFHRKIVLPSLNVICSDSIELRGCIHLHCVSSPSCLILRWLDSIGVTPSSLFVTNLRMSSLITQSLSIIVQSIFQIFWQDYQVPVWRSENKRGIHTFERLSQYLIWCNYKRL